MIDLIKPGLIWAQFLTCSPFQLLNSMPHLIKVVAHGWIAAAGQGLAVSEEL
jgi:hypothetical protein